jgi:hypothetical protein
VNSMDNTPQVQLLAQDIHIGIDQNMNGLQRSSHYQEIMIF